MEKMISSNAIHSLFTPPSRLPLSLNRRTHSTITPSCSSPLAFLSIRRTRTALSHLRGSPRSTVVRGIMLGNEEAESEELDDLPVDLCYTRTLPPALTLERGMAGIREEVERLKANPPRSSSGIVRIQVFVPPSAKALRLLCGQPQLSGVFPQFYLSKQNLDETTVDLHSLSGTLGLSGFGAAVYFRGSSRDSREWRSIKRKMKKSRMLRKFQRCMWWRMQSSKSLRCKGLTSLVVREKKITKIKIKRSKKSLAGSAGKMTTASLIVISGRGRKENNMLIMQKTTMIISLP